MPRLDENKIKVAYNRAPDGLTASQTPIDRIVSLSRKATPEGSASDSRATGVIEEDSYNGQQKPAPGARKVSHGRGEGRQRKGDSVQRRRRQ